MKRVSVAIWGSVAQDPLEYGDLMTAALGYLDEAISIANGATFTIPASWMAAEVSSAQLARLADFHSRHAAAAPMALPLGPS